MVDRDRAPAAMTDDARRGERFTQPGDAVAIDDGDASTTPEALAYLAEHGADAWRARYLPAADTGGVVS